MLQEGPDDTSYGSFLDGDLRELLAALCQRDHESLAVLTSRFVFADLDRFLGTAFHQLDLHGLAPDNGARLLEELNVRGRPAEREQVSEEIDGHPLGLRVFADALPEDDRDEPWRFMAEGLGEEGKEITAAGHPRPTGFRGGSAWRRKPPARTPISVIIHSPQIQ